MAVVRPRNVLLYCHVLDLLSFVAIIFIAISLFNLSLFYTHHTYVYYHRQRRHCGTSFRLPTQSPPIESFIRALLTVLTGSFLLTNFRQLRHITAIE